jgi:hypothetical protein
MRKETSKESHDPLACEHIQLNTEFLKVLVKSRELSLDQLFKHECS